MNPRRVESPSPALQARTDSMELPGDPFLAEFIVERYLQSVRVDSFLLRHLRNYTPYCMQRMIRAGMVQVDGVTVPIEHRVRRGESVSIRLIEPPDKLLSSEPGPLEILYEDPWLIVINKPAGQIAHPVGMHNTDTLCNAVQYHLDRQTPRPGLLRPGIVHRLDRYTSGVIAVTKEHLSHRLLSIEFQRGKVSKQYVALVDGVVERDEFLIDRPIGQAAHNGCVLMSCSDDARDPRPASTSIEVLQKFAAHTLVRAIPFTGRNHQIRVHLAGVGHPVVADEFYLPFGAIKPTRFDDFEVGEEPVEPTLSPQEASASDLISRHALHACQLRFRHPISREVMQFEAPLPVDMRAAMEKLAKPCRRSTPLEGPQNPHGPHEPRLSTSGHSGVHVGS